MSYKPDIIISLISRIIVKVQPFIESELKSNKIVELKPVHGDILFALFKNGELSMKAITGKNLLLTLTSNHSFEVGKGYYEFRVWLKISGVYALKIFFKEFKGLREKINSGVVIQ